MLIFKIGSLCAQTVLQVINAYMYLGCQKKFSKIFGEQLLMSDRRDIKILIL